MAKPVIVACPNGVATKILNSSLVPRDVKILFEGFLWVGTANDVSSTANSYPMSGEVEESVNILSELWVYNDQGVTIKAYVWVQ